MFTVATNHILDGHAGIVILRQVWGLCGIEQINKSISTWYSNSIILSDFENQSSRYEKKETQEIK